MDFGLAKKFVSRSKFHIPKIRKSGVTGTLRWTSLHVHLNCESARRDDVLSWIYMMLYMCAGKLPWQGTDAPNKKTKNIKIAKQKMNLKFIGCLKNIPLPVQDMVRKTKGLKFIDCPPYQLLYNLCDDLATSYSSLRDAKNC